MLRLTVAAGIASVCAVMLTGCSDSASVADPVTSPPTSSGVVSTPPTTPPRSPLTSSLPPMPVIPPLAKQNSIPGARAFVGVFVREMNVAWSTTQTAGLRSLFGRGCASCESIAAGIDGIHEHSGKTEGALWSIAALTSIPLQPSTQPIIHTAIKTSPGRWKPNESSPWRRLPGSTVQWDFHLNWTGQEWAMSQAVSQ